MRSESPALAATLRALRGEPDVWVVAPALHEWILARVLALAPNVDPSIRVLGALAGRLLALLTPGAIESPSLHAALASLIGTDAGNRILKAWADVAPVGWGESHAAALIDAVRSDRCPPWAAAALIGPTENAAALLHEPWEMTAAIRRWGEATSDDPTAWMDALTPTERDRLLDALRHAPDAAECLPWLPEELATMSAVRIDASFLSYALNAYAIASPVARDRHATVLPALIQRAKRDDLAALTRLAVATGMDAAWTAVERLLHKAPGNAVPVVATAAWDDVRADVQETILSFARRRTVCAAIAFARGVRDQPPPITRETARAFFAAVTRESWNALMEEERRMWLSHLNSCENLAVRSLGPTPSFLAHAFFDDALIAAVRRHLHDDAAIRRTLLPIAVRDLPPDAVPAIVAALPAPPDPVAFVHIAGGAREMPLPLRDWITAHPTPQARGAAITFLHAAVNRGAPIEHCNALAHALAGWSWVETHALLDALPDDGCDALRPNPDVLAQRLTLFDRRTDFLQTLDAIAALSPSVAIPAYHALHVLATMQRVGNLRYAGEGLAQALRTYGDRFLAIVDALDVACQTEMLPTRDNETRDGIRALASADPLVAHRLAHALREPDPAAALDALAAAGTQDVRRLWRFMSDALQRTILGGVDALTSAVAAPERVDDLAQALRAWGADDPLPLLALRMLIDADEARRARGAAILAQHPDVAVSLLPLLREDLRTTLMSNPIIAFACADLPLDRRGASASAWRRRR